MLVQFITVKGLAYYGIYLILSKRTHFIHLHVSSLLTDSPGQRDVFLLHTSMLYLKVYFNALMSTLNGRQRQRQEWDKSFTILDRQPMAIERQSNPQSSGTVRISIGSNSRHVSHLLPPIHLLLRSPRHNDHLLTFLTRFRLCSALYLSTDKMCPSLLRGPTLLSSFHTLRFVISTTSSSLAIFPSKSPFAKVIWLFHPFRPLTLAPCVLGSTRRHLYYVGTTGKPTASTSLTMPDHDHAYINLSGLCLLLS